MMPSYLPPTYSGSDSRRSSYIKKQCRTERRSCGFQDRSRTYLPKQLRVASKGQLPQPLASFSIIFKTINRRVSQRIARRTPRLHFQFLIHNSPSYRPIPRPLPYVAPLHKEGEFREHTFKKSPALESCAEDAAGMGSNSYR